MEYRILEIKKKGSTPIFYPQCRKHWFPSWKNLNKFDKSFKGEIYYADGRALYKEKAEQEIKLFKEYLESAAKKHNDQNYVKID